ncbi:hypothetical protein AK88_02875 [Plasmodium fragile]|uniref:C3H1-type domain-containing protein n=1 Tax=Plasmodium fragile TaxID=5857 RepID=A0A0D9QKF1_PLAFR|nr:uncharacterized protein AK88_02875 [Plasmodium fragile]KJP87443.1 hypothetical protein AK88_02875 [Plasmodium fragile]
MNFKTTLYKTQLCSFYAKGICARGNKCSWAHGELDVRPMPKFYKTRMCYTFLSGSYCEASKCTFAHTEEELRGSGKALRLCTKYFLDGYCAKADKCPMAHNINQLDPSVKFSSSELMNRMYNDEGDVEEEGDEPMFYKRKSNKKRDERESNDGDKCNANINGGEPLNGKSNMYNVKDQEETAPDKNRTRYAGMSHLEEAAEDAPCSHAKTFNFLKSHAKKTYSEYLLEGSGKAERDGQKGGATKGEKFANVEFTPNGEFVQSGQYAQMGDQVSCREFTYDDNNFVPQGEDVPSKFFTYRFNGVDAMSGVDAACGDHLGKAKLSSEYEQNGFPPAENVFLPSTNHFINSFGSMNKLDKGSVHANVDENVNSNVHANVQLAMLNEMDSYNHLNVQAENYFFNNIKKKKEYPENSFFDSNTTTYEHVRGGSNFYSDGMMCLNRTKENINNCYDMGLRFNYNGSLGVQNEDFGQGGGFNLMNGQDSFNCKVMNGEDSFNRFSLESLIQNMNNLSLGKKQMPTLPLVKTVNGESASDGEPEELKDTKEGEMGSQGDMHTGEDTHSEEEDHSGDNKPTVTKAKHLSPEEEQIYKGPSFPNKMENDQFKMLFLSEKFPNHANQLNGYSGKGYNGVGEVTYTDLTENGVANLCSVRDVQTTITHLYNHHNGTPNGTPESSHVSGSRGSGSHASGRSAHNQMMDSQYDLSSMYRKLNAQRSLTGVKTLQQESINHSVANVFSGQHYPSANNGFPRERGAEKKMENYDLQGKKHFLNYMGGNGMESGGTSSGHTHMGKVSEKDGGARVPLDGVFLTNASQLPRGHHGSIMSGSGGSRGSHGSHDGSGNDTVMKNILMGKTNLYCTPNCSGVNGDGIENSSRYNSREERNITKVDPSGQLGQTKNLHDMLMNDCTNGMSSYEVGDFFFLKNARHLNGLTYLHEENALQGTTNNFADKMNLVNMCEVNYGSLRDSGVGFTRPTQQRVVVEGGLLNGGNHYGACGGGIQGQYQNRGYENDYSNHAEYSHVGVYTQPNHLIGMQRNNDLVNMQRNNDLVNTQRNSDHLVNMQRNNDLVNTQRNNSPLNPHMHSYEMVHKSDGSFSNYVHNASREVAKIGQTNSVTEKGRRG